MLNNLKHTGGFHFLFGRNHHLFSLYCVAKNLYECTVDSVMDY